MIGENAGNYTQYIEHMLVLKIYVHSQRLTQALVKAILVVALREITRWLALSVEELLVQEGFLIFIREFHIFLIGLMKELKNK